jgi:YbbR-like protein
VKELAPHGGRGLLARIALENYPLKLLSLGLAIALFSIVHSDQDAQRSMFLDVVALLPPRSADRVLVSSLPAQVKVTLRGSRSRIAALQHDDFAPVQMDLRETGRQSYDFDATAIDVSGPVQVVEIEPRSVPLVWRTRAVRMVPVRVKLRGSPEEGLAIKKPMLVTPAMVQISGPSEEIERIAEVFTEDVNIDNMSEGTHERRAKLEPPQGHIGYLEQDTVSIQLDAVADQGERTFRHLDVAVLGPGAAQLRPAAVSVTLHGPLRALSELEPEQVVPYVELPSAVSGTGVEVLDVKLRGVPEAFTASRITPNSVIAKRNR